MIENDYQFDPFEMLRKNAHVWDGDKTTLWYHEKLDGSFTLIALYDFRGSHWRLFLAVDNWKNRVEFKNEEITKDLHTQICMEIESFKGMSGMK